MEIFLNLTFEQRFLDKTQGSFRKSYRSCQSALKQVAKWNGYDYAIEGSIKGYFDNIHHTLLASFLEKEIQDKQFRDLYWNLARAGFVVDYKFIDSNLGVTQGEFYRL